MKNLFFLIAFVLQLYINIKASPNPIMVYSAKVEVNELYFDTQGEWTMELLIWFSENVPYSDTAIKSIYITSNTGEATVLNFSINSPYTYLVITKDSLASALYINPENDVIIVGSIADRWSETGEYLGTHGSESAMGYGYPPLSMIEVIPEGCSISLDDDKYINYLDSSPTIGNPNDTLGGLGQIHGRMYDIFDYVFTSGNFKLQSCLNLSQFIQFHPEDSTFTSVHLANANSEYTIIYFNDSLITSYLEIDYFKTNLLPGMTNNFDIHLRDSGFVFGLNNPLPPELKKVVVAPNPFSTELQLFVELNDIIQNSELHIFNSLGMEVLQMKLPEEKAYKIAVPAHSLGVKGTYFYQIVNKKRLLASGKLLYI